MNALFGHESNSAVERTFDTAAGLLPQAAVRVKRRSPLR